MSRVVLFDVNGNSSGEVHAPLTRTWFVSDGGQTELKLKREFALQKNLQLGRMVLVEREPLPAWAGMIDTPWSALLPVQVAVYSCEYLLAIRELENPLTLTGSAGSMALKLLEAANATEDLLIRPGEIEDGPISAKEAFTQTSIWAQLKDLANKSGMKIQLRPERDPATNQLRVYFDMKRQLGIYTNYQLRGGGPKRNLEITRIAIETDIRNRVIGISDQSTKAGRLQTEPVLMQNSIDTYRLRSKVMQISGVNEIGLLTDATRILTEASANPRIQISGNVMDVDDAFALMRRGNRFDVHAPQAYLPGGRRGWSGVCELSEMTYDESRNRVGITLEGVL